MKSHYWVRLTTHGTVIAALSEKLTPPADLGNELIELAQGGPIERVFTEPPVLNRPLVR